MAALKVNAFASRIVGYQHEHIPVLHETLNDLAAVFTRNPAMNDLDSVMPAPPVRAAWAYRTSIFSMITGSAGTSANMPLRPVLTLLIWSTMSVPAVTLPNTA